jgi:lipopolysaccharide export system protein LptC
VAKTGFLQQWQPQEIERQLRSIPRLLKLILLSKWMLGLLVVGLLAAVIALPLLQDDESAIRIVFNDIPKRPGNELPVMLNPRYESADGDNQLYTIRAKQAIQHDVDTVELQHINADIGLESGSWLAMQAKQGMLKLNNKKMYLRGKIHIFSDDGYELHSEESYLDLAEGSAYAAVPIWGQGPMGSIKADGYRLSANAQRAKFTGNVKLVIRP